MMYSLLLAGILFVQPAAPDKAIQRIPRNGGIYVVAHRGVHEGIPENTLAAYRKAIELGADFVEIDVRETKDGALVSTTTRWMTTQNTKDCQLFTPKNCAISAAGPNGRTNAYPRWKKSWNCAEDALEFTWTLNKPMWSR